MTHENNRQIKPSKKKNGQPILQENSIGNGSFKNGLIQEIGKDLLDDLESLTSLLEKKKKMKEKLGDFQSTLRDFNKTTLEKEFHRNDYLKDVRESKIEKQIESLSNQMTFECHLKILRSSLYLGNSELFLSFLESALHRADLFHFEKPYISDIILMESENKVPIVEKDYTMINVDLNEPHLIQQIDELRGKFWTQNSETVVEGRASVTLDQPSDKKNLIKINPKLFISKKELQSIGYRFLYILVKHSENAGKAITHLEVEIAKEQEGPVKKREEGWTCRPIPICQYRGIKATYGTIPWLCFRADHTSSRYLSKISPLISLSKYVRPKFGYEKIETDLRQVPKEFIKLTNIHYSYLTCKFENSLLNNKLLLNIFQKFYILEKSYSIGKNDPIETQQEAGRVISSRNAAVPLRHGDPRGVHFRVREDPGQKHEHQLPQKQLRLFVPNFAEILREVPAGAHGAVGSPGFQKVSTRSARLRRFGSRENRQKTARKAGDPGAEGLGPADESGQLPSGPAVDDQVHPQPGQVARTRGRLRRGHRVPQEHPLGKWPNSSASKSTGTPSSTGGSSRSTICSFPLPSRARLCASNRPSRK